MPTTRKLAAVMATAFVVVLGLGAPPASACGGLIGENGSIRLTRTSTLAAWHDGVEHYVTSFEFSGTGESVGSIIPLPAVPTKVEAAGQWTLQRLEREVAPVFAAEAGAASASTASFDKAEVLLTTQVDALDITVLRGGGDEVGRWALDNGFFLTPDAPEVLDYYAARSPIFLAAKFDASRAAAQGLNGGDGTPIHIAMPTAQPWVPLRILGLGLPTDDVVQADVFLMTDRQPDILTGGGVVTERSVAASDSLMTDLRSDRNTDWMPEHMWLTHLVVGDTAGRLHYDLSVSQGRAAPSIVAAGFRSPADTRPLGVDDGWARDAAALSVTGAVVVGATLIAFARRRARA